MPRATDLGCRFDPDWDAVVITDEQKNAAVNRIARDLARRAQRDTYTRQEIDMGATIVISKTPSENPQKKAEEKRACPRS